MHRPSRSLCVPWCSQRVILSPSYSSLLVLVGTQEALMSVHLDLTLAAHARATGVQQSTVLNTSCCGQSRCLAVLAAIAATTPGAVHIAMRGMQRQIAS